MRLRAATSAVKLHLDRQERLTAVFELESILSQFKEGWETYDVIEARRVLKEIRGNVQVAL